MTTVSTVSLKSWQSPNLAAVAAISRALGTAMTLERYASIALPDGTCQIWEFKPLTGTSMTTVAVFFKADAISSWTLRDDGFDATLLHYRRQAKSRPVNPPALPRSLDHMMLPPGIKAVLPGDASCA